MRTAIYVSNVAMVSNLGALEDLFMTVGDVLASRIETIPESGQKAGFGVFEMFEEFRTACADYS